MLQAYARGWLARAQFARMHASATAIQRAWRRFARRKHAAIAIQAAWRGWAARAELVNVRRCARVLQRVVMRYCARRAFARRRFAVWRLESCVRAYLGRKYELEYQRFQETVR
jgi:hypothetical protein